VMSARLDNRPDILLLPTLSSSSSVGRYVLAVYCRLSSSMAYFTSDLASMANSKTSRSGMTNTNESPACPRVRRIAGTLPALTIPGRGGRKPIPAGTASSKRPTRDPLVVRTE